MEYLFILAAVLLISPFVLRLASFVLNGNCNVGRNVRDADRGVSGIH